MKRNEKSRYVPPALRSKFNRACEDKIEYDKGQHAREAADMQTYSLGKHGSPQRMSTNAVPRRVRSYSSSSSSNPKSTSDESCKDDDSSDFSDNGVVAMNNLKISKETEADNSTDHWKKGGGRLAKNYGIEMENYETNVKKSNKQLSQHKDDPDLKSHSNQDLNSESNKKKGLFYNYGDSSISDIEAVTDIYTEKRSTLTSTPNSDIVDEMVLDAAKYVPQGESAMESTLLHENDIQTTINGNRNNCDYNFEIYHDPPSVQKQPKKFSELFDNNYIPPPVPPPAHGFRLPPIHRLPFRVSSPYVLFVPRPAFPKHMPQLLTQTRHPRLLLPPSLQLYSDFPRSLPYRSSYIPRITSSVSSLCLKPQSDPLSTDPPRMHFSILRPRSLRGRANSPHSRQDLFNPPNLGSDIQDDHFYIPPPVPPPWIRDKSSDL